MPEILSSCSVWISILESAMWTRSFKVVSLTYSTLDLEFWYRCRSTFFAISPGFPCSAEARLLSARSNRRIFLVMMRLVCWDGDFFCDRCLLFAAMIVDDELHS